MAVKKTAEQLQEELAKWEAEYGPLDARAKAIAETQINTATGEPAPSVATPGIPAAQVPATDNDFMRQLEDVYAQRGAQLRESILAEQAMKQSALEAQEEKITPAFREARRGMMTKGQLAAQSAKKYMQSKGYDLGSTLQRGTQIGAATQAGIGDLYSQEAQERSDIARQMADLQMQTASQLRAGQLGLGADFGEAALSERQRQEQLAIQEAGLTGMYKGQQTMTGISNAMKTRMNELSLQEQEYAMKQMQDPNSAYNQLEQLKLQAQRMDNQKLALQIQELQNEPVTNALEEELLKLQLEQAIQELKEPTAQIEPMDQVELEKQSKQYVTFMDSLITDARTEMERRSPGVVFTEDQYVQAAIPNIIQYLQSLEASGIDPQIIDHLLSRYGLPTGR